MSRVPFLKPLAVKEKIRLGRNSDGGYVVYGRSLSESDVLISYGVGSDISFEEHFNRLTNKPVLMFDPTMFGERIINFKHLRKLLFHFYFKKAYTYLRRSGGWWKKLKQLKAKNILFINEGISASKSYKYDTFANHVQRFNLEGKQLLLKIDIEGNEYDIFREGSIYDHLLNVDQLLFEFHDLKNRLREVEAILVKLGREFELVHVHGNNYGETFFIYDFSNGGKKDLIMPDALEITLVKRTKILEKDIISQPESYPIAHLDFPNDATKPDIPVEFV